LTLEGRHRPIYQIHWYSELPGDLSRFQLLLEVLEQDLILLPCLLLLAPIQSSARCLSQDVFREFSVPTNSFNQQAPVKVILAAQSLHLS
jgi:hypothetical protein